MYVDPVEFASLSLTARIRIVSSELLGFGYGPPGFPRPPGALEELAGLVDSTKLIDCSSLAAFVLFEVFDGFTFDHYRQIQIYDAAQPFSNLAAVVSAGVGSVVAAPIPGRWHLMQTWHGLEPLKGGHTRIVYCDGDQLEALESTGLGNGGPRWSALSWAGAQTTYEGLGLAVLSETI